MSKDNDHRKTATYILGTANKVVTTERGGQHGGAEDSFQMIADMWMVYINHTNRPNPLLETRPGRIVITPKDVALMMDLLKTARHTYGDPMNDDNFIDKAGYTGLAAALAGIQAPAAVPASTKPVAPQPPEHPDDAALTRQLAERLAPDQGTIVTQAHGNQIMNHSLFESNGVHCVVDGQFGSTGKGVLAAWLAKMAVDRNHYFRVCVSNAGPNSGHTFYHKGEKHVLKQLPTFAVASALLGQPVDIQLSAGALIDPEILCAEASKYPMVTIWVHPQATVIDSEDKQKEQTGTIAAVAGTRSGTGAALARKIMRDPSVTFRKLWTEQHFPPNVYVGDLLTLVDIDWTRERIFMEVSQGFSLGIHSDFYPKVTSRECTVMQGIADARLPPQSVKRTYLSMRTFPIRVGNFEGHSSGDCYPDQRELTWEELQQTPELTTVTQRIRRVFTFSEIQASEAIAANAPDFVFLNFLNYLDEPGQARMLETMDDLSDNAARPFEIITCNGPTSEDVSW